MSITDELRHNIEGAEQLYGCECKHLLDIADRIDAEHEEALSQAYMDVSDSEWVRLPKDADDVPWHPGDCDEDGKAVGIREGRQLIDESQECYFKWSLADNGWADHTCSKCGFVENTDIHVGLDWNYCPNCGRKVVSK